MPRSLIQFAYIQFMLLAGPLVLTADDWPQWRGQERDGVWRETGIMASFPESGLKVRWRAKVGNGYSGPAVAKGRVYVTDRRVKPEAERVLCFDEATGKPLWEHAYAAPYANMEYGNGPRATPTVHEGKVYTLGTRGHVRCLDAVTGEIIWKKNLVQEFDAKMLTYGFSAAPLVEGDLVILCAAGRPDACILALDRNTGEERWRAIEDRSSYSAPIVVVAGGRRQLIAWTADNVNSLDPATGKVLWQIPRKTSFDEAEVVASPVLHKDKLLCLSAWSRPSLLLQLDKDEPAASVVWKSRQKPATTIATPLFQDDSHFYAALGDGNLGCIDATTGEEVWTTQEPTGKRLGTAHLTPNGDRVFIFNQVGNLILAKLTPAGYQELGRTLLVEPTAGYRAQGLITWAHPAYANKHVFARSDRELVCASLAAGEAREAEPKPTIKVRLLTDKTPYEAPSSLAFAPGGQALATGAWTGAVTFVDLATGKELAQPARHKDFVTTVGFSADGKYMVSAGGSEFTPARNQGKTSGQIKLWDAAERKELGELAGHTNKVFAAAFSPDGKTLATGSADQTVRLWNSGERKEVRVFEGHAEAVFGVAFSPDGKTLASASADHTVILWNAVTGERRATLSGHEDEVRAVAFSPDGATLATGSADWTVRLWDLITQRERTVLKGHQGSINCLAFSPDGKTLASGSGDQTVKLWNPATSETTATLRGHKSGVTSLAFAPGGFTLATAGVDDPIHLWELPKEE